MNIINSQSLNEYNTFKVNSIAEFFTTINNENELIQVLTDNRFRKKKKFVLGGGSNILFTQNIEGVVIHNKIRGINIIKETDKNILVESGSGETWDDLVKWSTQRNLYGIENLSLIPGYVGAAPIQNIGAYGVELKDVFKELEAINLEKATTKIFKRLDCQFGYRNSIFKKKFKNQFIITKIRIQLSKKRKINIAYQSLKEKFKNKQISTLTSQDIREAVIQIRTSKLPNPKNLPNAGSFFKNPIISKSTLNSIKEKYPDIPVFKKINEIKVPAAWLIEQSQLKGFQNKTCGVYNKHSLVLVNHKNATGKDIMNLAQKIKNMIYEKFNILLEEEVSIL